MIKVKVTMTPAKPSAKIRSITRQLEDRRQVMEQSKRYMIERWTENFGGQGSVYGPWPANSEWKEGSGPMQGKTGALAAYFERANEAGVASRDSVKWHFSNDADQYSVTHSESGINPNPLAGHAGIPRRVLWDMNETDRRRIMRLIETWIDEKVSW